MFLWVFAVIGFSLYVHAVDTVEHVEVVDVYRTGVGFHRGENIGQRYAWTVLPCRGPHRSRAEESRPAKRKTARKAPCVAQRNIHQGVDGLYEVVERGVATRFQLHFKTARCTQPGNDRSGVDKVNFAFGIFLEIRCGPRSMTSSIVFVVRVPPTVSG